MKKSLGSKALAYPTPVWCIGSYDKEGKPNVMTVAWGGVCSSSPPAVTVSLRKQRYSYDSILERKAYTVNIPSADYIAEADYFGIASGKKEDKFKISGLTPLKSDLVDAPYIKEFPLILECRLVNTLEVGVHIQFIGEIVDIKAEESVLGENGLPDMKKVNPLVYAPEVKLYYNIGELLGKAFSIGKR